jgi:oxygen-independent coproporphyrinogen III oxidase
VTALKNELQKKAKGECVRSIYFGGGTPSLLSAEDIGGILSVIRTHFTVDKAAEITIEANPGTINQAYLADIRKQGVNRLSLGVQSLNDRELVLLGRIHTAAEAKEAVKLAQASGFDNLNIDLIYGLPAQALSDWRQTLEEALLLEPEHISLYALTLEEDTPMWNAISQNFLPALNPDHAADMYELAEDLLAARGYIHYEISNWARPGRECQHNLIYWHNLPYLGIGAAAHSCSNGRRFANTKDMDKYLAYYYSGKKPPLPELDEEISPELELSETVILGLRLNEGVNAADIQSRFGIDLMEHYQRQIEEMAAAGLLEQGEGNIRLTRRGRLLSNEVFWRLLPE